MIAMTGDGDCTEHFDEGLPQYETLERRLSHAARRRGLDGLRFGACGFLGRMDKTVRRGRYARSPIR
jgi:hypothetical protein